MKRWQILSVLWVLGAVAVATATLAQSGQSGMTEGKPQIQSMSALAFAPDGTLFVGDGKGGKVYAIDLGDGKKRGKNDAVQLKDVEGKIAALLGTTASEVMIHDMAVNPVTQNTYFAVSRGRGEWSSRWLLPNDIAVATVLLVLSPDGKLDEASLASVSHTAVALPNPVDASKKHRWKDGISLRADTITDIALSGGVLYVAGLSNEEFASTLWQIPYPFKSDVKATTLEVYHGAHGEYETHAPIRTFVPYSIGDEDHLLAAYLCTPFVTFKADDLANGKHIKGRTVAEFGSGNYPLDMIVYQKNGEDRLLIANSNLPFMIVDPDDVAGFEGEINTEVEGYVAGVSYEVRSGTGIQQMDLLNGDFVLALQRLPGGTMDLVSIPVRRF